MAWTQSGNIKGASGIPGASGASGAQGASGPTGATGASGGTGGTGGPGISRIVQTITAPTTLASAASTDYVTFCNGALTDVTNNAQSLLAFNGSNGSTTITDGAVSPTATWTASGSAQLSTATKKFGTASLSVNGSTSYVSSTSVAAFNFGTLVPFTVECWVYPSNTTSGTRTIFTQPLSVNSRTFIIYQSGTNIAWYIGNAGLTTWAVNTEAAAFTANTWHHVALVGNGTGLVLYVDGVSKLTTTQLSWISANRYFEIGGDTQLGWYFNGFIDDFKVSRTNIYTAAFTPPTTENTNTYITNSFVPATPTLPTATGSTSQYTIRNISGSSITVGVTSSQQIDGATGGLALANNTVARLISDGTGWRTV